MAITITRTAIVNDSGTGTDGTALDNTWKQEFYDQIDAALSALLPLAGGTMTGALAISGLGDLAGLSLTSTGVLRPVISFLNVTTGAIGQLFFSNVGAFEVRRNIGGNTALLQVDENGNMTVTKYIQGAEQTAPSAPPANGYRLYAQDNGAGKTQLMVLFNSGAAQQLAIQP